MLNRFNRCRLPLGLLIASVLFVSVVPAQAPDWSRKVLDRLAQAPARPLAPEPEATFVLRVHATDATLPADRAAQLVGRLLPAGANARALEGGAGIAVLASQEAHDAVAELLAAARTPAPNQDAPLSPEMAAALARMTEGDPAARAAIESLRSDLTSRLDALAPTPVRPAHLVLAGGCVAAVAASTFWIRRRSKHQARMQPPAPLPPVTSEIERALLPETRRQADDIKLALRELGQHLQLALEARETERAGLQARVLALEEGGLSIAAESREALNAATRSLEGTAERLTRENDRVQALAGELHGTLTELDQARDRLRQAETALMERDRALMRQTADLDHERAKLAALSIILERLDGPMVRSDALEVTQPEPPKQQPASPPPPAASPLFTLIPRPT